MTKEIQSERYNIGLYWDYAYNVTPYRRNRYGNGKGLFGFYKSLIFGAGLGLLAQFPFKTIAGILYSPSYVQSNMDMKIVSAVLYLITLITSIFLFGFNMCENITDCNYPTKDDFLGSRDLHLKYLAKAIVFIPRWFWKGVDKITLKRQRFRIYLALIFYTVFSSAAMFFIRQTKPFFQLYTILIVSIILLYHVVMMFTITGVKIGNEKQPNERAIRFGFFKLNSFECWCEEVKDELKISLKWGLRVDIGILLAWLLFALMANSFGVFMQTVHPSLFLQ